MLVYQRVVFVSFEGSLLCWLPHHEKDLGHGCHQDCWPEKLQRASQIPTLCRHGGHGSGQYLKMPGRLSRFASVERGTGWRNQEKQEESQGSVLNALNSAKSWSIMTYHKILLGSQRVSCNFLVQSFVEGCGLQRADILQCFIAYGKWRGYAKGWQMRWFDWVPDEDDWLAQTACHPIIIGTYWDIWRPKLLQIPYNSQTPSGVHSFPQESYLSVLSV